LQAAYASGGVAALTERVQFDHERKVPVATGRIATPDEIKRVRETVIGEIAEWLDEGHLTGLRRTELDARLGRVLHHALEIVPADAAHEGTWSFLTLVVFPDVAAIRFPDFHVDRFVGTPRNALRRTWQRFELLGDLPDPSAGGLREDELVGLLERTQLVRNRALAQALASRVMAYTGTKRSQWARDLYKIATFQSGLRLLDALDQDDIESFVASLDPSPAPAPAG
jgi:hypothetical protein